MEEISHLVNQIRKVEHFKRLSVSDLAVIVTSGQVKHYKTGSTLFSEGDPCSGMYVLLSGKVDLYKSGPEGQISILNTLEPVIMFNEVPVLDGGDNPVSAVAAQDTNIWFVTCARFQILISRFPELATGLLRVMARRNRTMIAHYGDLSFRTVTARLAKHLLVLSENGALTIDRTLHPNTTVSSRVVTTPEAISRTLKMIESRKIIELDRKSIKIIDLTELQQLAQIDL